MTEEPRTKREELRATLHGGDDEHDNGDLESGHRPDDGHDHDHDEDEN